MDLLPAEILARVLAPACELPCMIVSCILVCKWWYRVVRNCIVPHSGVRFNCAREYLNVIACVSAVRAGHISLFHWLYERDFHPYFVWKYAAATGDIPLLRSVDRPSARCKLQASRAAAAHGQLEVLKWLCVSGHIKWDEVINGAAAHNRLDMIEYALEHAPEGHTAFAVCEAMSHGHIDAAESLIARHMPVYWNDVWKCAIRGGHADVLEWLCMRAHCITTNMYQEAANCNNVPAMEHMRKHKVGLPASVSVREDYTDVVKWLREHGVQVTTFARPDNGAKLWKWMSRHMI